MPQVAVCQGKLTTNGSVKKKTIALKFYVSSIKFLLECWVIVLKLLMFGKLELNLGYLKYSNEKTKNETKASLYFM